MNHPYFDYFVNKAVWNIAARNMVLDEICKMRSIPRHYRSIWRVLHVDGFEDKQIRFFRYEKLKVD